MQMPWDSHVTSKKKTSPGRREASGEELRIWRELEEEVEKTLEEEIKDQIYHLALRLNRLYQHQMERTKEKSFSEVNISISVKGRTKVKIKTNSSPETTRVPVMATNKMHARPLKIDGIKTRRS